MCVRDASGMPLSSQGAHAELRTASVGKVLLLLSVAGLLCDGSLSADEMLRREPVDAVADSGLWWQLSVDALPLADVAQLVGAVSDNLATNVLLRRVGVDYVARVGSSLGLERTALHDKVRDVRGPGDPATLSTGTAEELSSLMLRLETTTAMGPEPDSLVRQWLSSNVDLSMVGSAFVARLGLDPLAHLDGPIRFFNKTGTDAGVRADVGTVTVGDRTLAWAAIANWAPEDDGRLVSEAMAGMRRIGDEIVDRLTA
ncbi:MAG: serine hydrolase [Intrasporangium sp.]|uniref:serine hydrolase n=1 Tax=Intrasporangium sp. TaxID=1925024 RepID=UPI003F820115